MCKPAHEVTAELSAAGTEPMEPWGPSEPGNASGKSEFTDPVFVSHSSFCTLQSPRKAKPVCKPCYVATTLHRTGNQQHLQQQQQQHAALEVALGSFRQYSSRIHYPEAVSECAESRNIPQLPSCFDVCFLLPVASIPFFETIFNIPVDKRMRSRTSWHVAGVGVSEQIRGT